MKFNRKHIKIFSGVLALLLVAAPLFLYESAGLLGKLGYLGFFIANYLGFGIVVLPALVGTLNPALLIVAGSVGVTIDEYFAWYSGSISKDIKLKGNLHKQIGNLVEKSGLPAIFVLALIPFPDGIVYAISGFAAGFYHIPFWKFFLANFLGKLIRTTILVLFFLRLVNN